jgi:tripartite-type tricarboxylate transporter receptor subunit TctC
MDTDLMGGQIQLAFDATPTALPLASAGKVRALGAGMAKRLEAMPDLPTLQEQGLPGFECYTWNAFLAPAGTPAPIVDKLNAAINKALGDPAVTGALQKAGINPTPGSTPAQTKDFLNAELAKWAPIIEASGAHID